jgi:hypothetical protein
MIQFYKPNAKMTGSACQFYLNYTDGSFFSTLIKQASWDANKKTGSFQANKQNPSKNVIIKLSPAEVAGIIDAIERDAEFKGYHSSSQQVVQFSFSPYMRDGKQVGYSYSVSKQGKEDSTQKASFLIGLYFNEARLLRQHLEFLLNKHFELQDEKMLEANKEEQFKKSQLPPQNSEDEDEIW